MEHTSTVPERSFEVAGLTTDVEILVDRWGIPHIRAQSRHDVYLAQGFNAARDRLFQIDLWRRRGLGELSEVFGSEHVEQDLANRLLRYRGDMDAEWAAYGPGVREAVESYVQGVNAYVDWVREDPDRLPPEFVQYAYEPAHWEAADVVRLRTHGLFYNVEHELARVRTLRSGGPVAEELRQAREPAVPLVVPEGLDLDALAPDVLRTYQLAFAPVSFGSAAPPASAQEAVSGSNNWVVDGARTATGRPLLASDPHRAVTMPSLRYIAHLSAPDLNVIGAGEPGLPGVSIGHNEHIAFGLTIWPADVEDLYVYALDGDDRYIGPAGSTPFDTITETVAVRGDAPDTRELRFTVHGPVLHVDRSRGVAIALRAVWLEPGMAPYLASLGYGDARTGDEFLDALEHWGAPAVNQVFATTDGDWGWQVAAKIPRRSGWDGSLPVPGTGAFEWHGFASGRELPAERRPERGWIATANEMNLSEEWAAGGLTATHDWYSSARASRLREWLDEHDRVSVRESSEMQTDTLSVHALALLGAFRDVRPTDPRVVAEWEALLAWDGRETAVSRAALIFQIWARRHLRPALVDARLRGEGITGSRLDDARSLIMKDESFGGDLRGDLALANWSRDPGAGVDAGELITRTLRASLSEIALLLGAETESAPWTWGRLHHASVSHPALARDDSVDPAWRTQGPVPLGGSGDTVGMAGYDSTFRQTIGSTFRMVLDVGNWDESVAMNSPGQSGDPRSPHYADLFDDWASGAAFPLVFSDAAVENAVTERITLRARADESANK